MADYVGKEVARDRLARACRVGTVVSVLTLLGGLFYGAIAGVSGTNTKIPDLLYGILSAAVPTLGEPVISMAECATKAVILLLAGIIGLLMFGKIKKTGDAFAIGQLRQFKFLALLTILLSFLPTVVANGVKIYLAMRQGGSPVAVMSFAVNGLCLAAGIFFFVAARVLVAGAVFEQQKEEPFATGTMPPTAVDYLSVPDMSGRAAAIAAAPAATEATSTVASQTTEVSASTETSSTPEA